MPEEKFDSLLSMARRRVLEQTSGGCCREVEKLLSYKIENLVPDRWIQIWGAAIVQASRQKGLDFDAETWNFR